MRRMKSWIGLMTLAGVLCAAGLAEAAVNAGVLFLRIAAGARAAGVGETFVAIADDATATHWNPAGLGEYPLNSQWVEFALPGYGLVRDAAVMKNGLPYAGADAYDLWILTDQGLLVLGAGEHKSLQMSGDSTGAQPDERLVARGRAANFVVISTSGVSSISAAIRRYAPFLTEDEADDIAARSAAQLMGIPPGELEPLLARLTESISPDYRDRTILENVVRDFRAACREGRLDAERMSALRQAFATLPQSGPADTETLDRVRFSMERSVSGHIPQSVDVALNDLLGSPIRALGGDGNHLYVAAAGRLAGFDGSRWDAIPAPTEEGWDAEGINCIDVTSGPRLWLGTDHGLLVRLTSEWKRYGASEGLPGEKVTKMAFSGARAGWVLTDAGLAALNEDTFSGTFSLTANVGDSVSTMLRRFLDTEDPILLASAEAEVLAANGQAPGYVPEAGSTLPVPYQLAVRGQITSLALDDYQRLWVGTTMGAMRFSQGRWVTHGYAKVVPTEATAARALAENQLGGRATPDRIEHFARIITEYNNLAPDGAIPAGRVIYTYRNPAAAPISCMAPAGDLFLVATEAGQLQVKSGEWSRYYHRDLERDQVRAVATHGRDVWFVTNDRVVLYMEPHREITFMHANWLPTLAPDIYYEYLSYVAPVEGWGTLGASVTFLSYGEILRTDERGAVGNSFHSFDGSFSISYGTRLSPSLAGGLSAKVIYSRLSDQGAGAEIGSGSATAFAMDAGLLYHTPWKRLTLGAALTNVGPNISYIDAQQSDPLPRNLALGFAYKLVRSPYNRVTLVGEMNKELVSLGNRGSELKQIIYNAGAEYSYGSVIALRAGYIYDEDGQVKTPTMGAGLAYQRFQLDFAYIPSTRDTPLANTLRVSMTGRF
jgi:hypothetical protein